MNNVLVTGGAGYIGSHIVEQLVKTKARIVIVDNLGKCWDDFFDPPLLLLGGENVYETKIYDLLSKKLKTPDVSSVEEAITIKIACNSFHSSLIGAWYSNHASLF